MPQTTHYALLETDLGWFGLAWSGTGLVRMQLPAAGREQTEAKLR